MSTSEAQPQGFLQRSYGLPLLLSGAVALVYWRTLPLPLIQDDWCIVYAIVRKGSLAYLSDIAGGDGAGGFYRPVAQLVLLLLYQVFKLQAYGYHLFALLLHVCNALLVSHIASRIGPAREVAWGVGLLYALALSVHLDTLQWVVGLHDVLGAFFFFLTVALFLRKQFVLAFFGYLCALLTKEATVVLPGILFLCGLFIRDREARDQGKNTLARAVKRTLPYAIAMMLYLGMRLAFTQRPGAGAGMTEADPYAMELFGPHLFSNLSLYVFWSFQSVLPFLRPSLTAWLVLGTLAAAGIWANRKSGTQAPSAPFLLGWTVLALLPVLFLVQHSYRYYLVYALPAVLMLIIGGLRSLSAVVSRNTAAFPRAAGALILLNLVYAYFTFPAMDRAGFNTPAVEGSNNLTRKAAIVTMVRDYLQETHPAVEPGTALIFDWVPVASFCGSCGPRLWYNDTTVSAYEIQKLRIDASGIHEVAGDGRLIDPAKAILLLFHGDSLREGALPFEPRPGGE